MATVRQQILNEEGIRRFCLLAANNLDNLTKDQWEMLLGLLKLRVTVRSKELITVNVALPPVKDATEIELSRLSGSFCSVTVPRTHLKLTRIKAPSKKIFSITIRSRCTKPTARMSLPGKTMSA